MRSPEIDALHDTYVAQSSSHLDDDQFGTLLLFFPALLVIASDGVIDDDEWVYVEYLAKFMAETYKEEVENDPKALKELRDVYLKELKYLLENLDFWEERFLDTLCTYLQNFPEVKEDVVDILHMFAEASDGESDVEAEKIEELSERLKLEE